MARGSPGPHHGHGSALAQGRPELALALPMELQGRPRQAGEGPWPSWIAREQAPMPTAAGQPINDCWLNEGIGPPTLAVGPHLLQKATAKPRPLGQGVVWGLPGVIQAAKGRLQASQPLPTDAGAANPKEPPKALGLAPRARGWEQARTRQQQQGRLGLGGWCPGRRHGLGCAAHPWALPGWRRGWADGRCGLRRPATNAKHGSSPAIGSPATHSHTSPKTGPQRTISHSPVGSIFVLYACPRGLSGRRSGVRSRRPSPGAVGGSGAAGRLPQRAPPAPAPPALRPPRRRLGP